MSRRKRSDILPLTRSQLSSNTAQIVVHGIPLISAGRLVSGCPAVLAGLDWSSDWKLRSWKLGSTVKASDEVQGVQLTGGVHAVWVVTLQRDCFSVGSVNHFGRFSGASAAARFITQTPSPRTSTRSSALHRTLPLCPQNQQGIADQNDDMNRLDTQNCRLLYSEFTLYAKLQALLGTMHSNS